MSTAFPDARLGVRASGALAVAVAATISLVSILALVLYANNLLVRHHRLPALERLDSRDRGVRFLTSTHGLLFFSLIAGDFLQALGFSINYEWFARGGVPNARAPTASCVTQAVLVQLGDTISAFSSLAIAVYVFLVFVVGWTVPRRWMVAVVAFLWILCGILAGIGPQWLQLAEKPFYGLAGSWCWITSDYQDARLYLHYLWVFIVAGVNIILYGVIALKILRYRSQIQTGPTSSQLSAAGSVALIMMIYPLVYIATILPLSAFRIAAMRGHRFPELYPVAAGTIFTLSGTANCIVYAFTRKIVSVHPSFKRKSLSVEIATDSRNPPSRFGRTQTGIGRDDSFLSRSAVTQEARRASLEASILVNLTRSKSINPTADPLLETDEEDSSAGPKTPLDSPIQFSPGYQTRRQN